MFLAKLVILEELLWTGLSLGLLLLTGMKMNILVSHPSGGMETESQIQQTKYKEDQKVSWHATPFEERLEKALSEESFISQRKNMEGKPIVFDENDESDTALSQLQTSSHPKSVVSF
nr:protein JASON-like [Malus domestica]